MNNTNLNGEFKVDDNISVWFEHCPSCKETRCIMRSDLCDETVQFQTKYYPGRRGMTIADSLKIDMRELIPYFEMVSEKGAPKGPFMVSTLISE